MTTSSSQLRAADSSRRISTERSEREAAALERAQSDYAALQRAKRELAAGQARRRG